MIASWSLFTSERVFTDTPVELLGVVTIVALIIGAYRHIECHQTGCHRFGRFVHGHYKLCHVHHPNVPSDGKITAEHIHNVGVAVTPPPAKPSPRRPKPKGEQ
jgi:hypothetical protein